MRTSFVELAQVIQRTTDFAHHESVGCGVVLVHAAEHAERRGSFRNALFVSHVCATNAVSEPQTASASIPPARSVCEPAGTVTGARAAVCFGTIPAPEN